MDPTYLFFRLTALILFVGVVWFITDPRPFRTRMRYYFSSHKTHLFITYCFIIAAQYGFLQREILTFTNNILLQSLGIAIMIGGFSYALWAKATMWKMWGPPGQHDIERQHTLMAKGPFAYSRNPIYLGLLIGMIGYFLALHSLLIVLLLIPFVYLQYVAIPREEYLLQKHFGKSYQEYKRKVRRWL